MPAYLASRYDVLARVGEGTYGVVWLARTRERPPRLLAVKAFKKEEGGGGGGDGGGGTAGLGGENRKTRRLGLQ